MFKILKKVLDWEKIGGGGVLDIFFNENKTLLKCQSTCKSRKLLNMCFID